MKALIGVCLVFLLALDATSGGLMFRHGAKQGDKEFKPCDDCYEEFALSNTYKLYGIGYSTAYINSNGFITLDEGVEAWDTSALRKGYDPALVAPYWCDTFLDHPDSHVWYRETTDGPMLTRAQKVIQRHFGDGCGADFMPTALLIVTWKDVISYCEDYCPYGEEGYEECVDYFQDYEETYDPDGGIFNREAPKHKNKVSAKSSLLNGKDWKWDGRNTFQLVLATDGSDTFAIINIKQIDWVFCYAHNKMLFNAGTTGVGFYVNPMHPTTGLATTSNVSKKGRWVYKISESLIQLPNCTAVGI